MGPTRFCLLFSVAVILGGLAISAPAAGSTSCASRLFADWRDGRIDGTYPIVCYRKALANLPEDVRVYSTASGDITRALQARLEKVSARAGSSSEDDGGSGSSPLVVLAICGAVLVAAGSLAAVVR